MTEFKIIQELNSVNIQKLIDDQKIIGRKNLPDKDIEYWSAIHLRTKEVIEDNRRGEQSLKMAQLLYLVTESIHHLKFQPIPKYYTYTEVRLLDWFIGKERQNYSHYKQRCIIGIYYLLKDFLRFESETLAGIESNNQEHHDNIDINDRIKKLKAVFNDTKNLFFDVNGSTFTDKYVTQRHATVEGYCNEESKVSGLIDFTCFPRTQTHDEYAFLRTIHIAEFCFLGIIITVKETIDNIKNNFPLKAAKCIRQSIFFANILHGVFKVLRTMPSKPINNFEFFRDETGNASAVQSKNYQELDVYLRGIDVKKKEVYDENEHLKYLQKFAHSSFTYNFKYVLSTLNENDEKWKEIFTSAREFDKKINTWKGLHLGFAYAYLPPDAMGTGSTSGASYLERFLKSSIFDETNFDYDIFKDNFSKEDFPFLHDMLTRVYPSIAIAI